MISALVVFLAIVLGAAVVTGAAYYLWQERRRVRREQVSDFRTLLLSRLRKRGPSTLEFERLVKEHGVPPAIARETAASLYASYCEQALADAQVTDDERRQLDRLQSALAITTGEATEIEARARDERYRAAALDALADGTITRNEATELEQLRTRLRLSTRQASEIVGAPAWDGYLALFRRVIADGRITSDEMEELRRFRKAIGISRDVANDIVYNEVVGLYRQWFYNIIQDGEVTADEEQGLAWLKAEFGLDALNTAAYEAQLQEVKQLAAYRRGELPTVRTRKLLEGGEICHWDAPCCFQWRTATQTKETEGNLVVTSKQVVFSSSIRSFSMSPSKIVDIRMYSDALVIQSASSRGTGTYLVRRPRDLEAVLVGLVRRHKFQLSGTYSSDLTRHIPDAVRREVWQRDQGQCVRCRATDYLEYDHVIPHSKGGANTVGNIQLLCRRCNNQKLDRI